MLTGRKRLPAEIARREGKVAPIRRAAAIGLLSLAMVAGLALSTDYTRTRGTLSHLTTDP
jgi:hypothetical protein